jgi:hypothetical protein
VSPLARLGPIWVAATVVLVSCAGGSSENAALPGLTPAPGTPRTAQWSALVDDLGAPIDDRDASPCHRGEPACFDAVIAEMQVRLDELGCDHRAPFAFTYLEMTKGVAAQAPTFEDPALLSVIDARFAQQYFDAIDNWTAGRTADVPAAWQLAFATAETGEATAAADLILGMNAHISRDLAYAVAQVIGSTDDLDEEPVDYTKINEVIGEVKDTVLAGATERFDPNLFLLDQDLGTESAPDPVALISQWRSRAFDLGIDLANASTAEELRAAETRIERESAAGASIILAADGAQRSGALDDLPLAGGFIALGPAERDSYCAEQRSQ